MNSKRIIALASFIDSNDIVVDVGCDHGYLSIYLKENKLCKSVIASDISKNALNYAIANIKKSNLDIKTVVSDGFNNILDEFNTAVIAGMGTSTIKSILKSPKRPQKLVLSSHNDYIELRYSMYKLGYKLTKEIVVKENNLYYPIMEYIKGKDKFSLKKIITGINDNKEYNTYLFNKNNIILQNKLPLNKKLKLKYINRCLKNKFQD